VGSFKKKVNAGRSVVQKAGSVMTRKAGQEESLFEIKNEAPVEECFKGREGEQKQLRKRLMES